MKRIFDDALWDRFVEYEHVLFLKRVEAFLELMPELVHCKDCKYYLPEKIELETAGNCMHEDGLCRIDYPRPDDFCSLGRRTKEDDKPFCDWCVFGPKKDGHPCDKCPKVVKKG